MSTNSVTDAKHADRNGGGTWLKQVVVSLSFSSWLTIVLVIETLAVAGFQSPLVRFDRFAIYDSGGELAIQDLMRRGYQPSIDFGYLYGLLPLLIGRVWYGLAGLTTEAFRVEVIACAVLTAWGMARFAASARISVVGFALIAAAIPDLLLVTYIGLVQSLEQALLVNALAEQASGRRGISLALLATCCFVKPSLAVVQGFLVVIAMTVSLRQTDHRTYIRTLLPALLTAGVLITILVANFGPVPFYRTILPTTGMAVYRLGGFGFFQGIGHDFWALPRAGFAITSATSWASGCLELPF